jgi:epoxyqueuosine reductase
MPARISGTRLCKNPSVNPAESSQWVCERARALGFDLCGVARAESWPELARLPDWLARGHAGEMRYLEDPRRQSPKNALANARSVIVCALNYNSAKPYSMEAIAPASDGDLPRGWISRYAWGTDYHEVLGAKLELLVAAMHEQFGKSHEARWYVDTGPVHERVAATHAGLGWLAKNTLLINPGLGSWLFLGVILTTLDLAPSLAAAESPPADLCGQCTLCIDACPTQAIVEPYVLDARRCISYLTIELRGAIPEELREPMGRHVFGCDICQDVCPWNRQSAATSEPSFAPREKLFAPELEWLASLSEEDFREVFRNSPVKRTKWRGVMRNVCVALGNSKLQRGTPAHQRSTELLARLASAEDALIAGHASWALARLGGTPAAAPESPAAG